MEETVQKSDKKIWIFGAIITLLTIGLFTGGFGLSGLLVGDPELKLEIGNSPMLGDPNAPITIYIFSDFSCPYCAAAEGYNEEIISVLRSQYPSWKAPMPEIKEKYVKTGKVKLVFKYFPGHGTAKAAHLVAWNLNDQDLFWEFEEKAFENQEETGNIGKMKKIAESLGADMQKLEAGLNSNKYENQFNSDFEIGKSVGIKGTPSFVINGKIITGSQSFEEFEKVIEKELSNN